MRASSLLQSKREEKAEAAGEADDWQDKLRRVDPLFAAVAAVPWIPEEEERRNYVQTKVLDELEASGITNSPSVKEGRKGRKGESWEVSGR